MGISPTPSINLHWPFYKTFLMILGQGCGYLGVASRFKTTSSTSEWHIVRPAGSRVPTALQFLICQISQNYRYCDMLLGLEEATANFLTLPNLRLDA